MEGNYLRQWKSAREASVELDYTYSSVNFNLNGKFNKCMNSIFKFEKLEEIEPYIYIRPSNVHHKFIIKKSNSGEILKIYKNTKECSEDLNTKKTTIHSLINKQLFKKLGFILEYGEKYTQPRPIK